MYFRQSLRRLGGAAIAAACVVAVSTAASAKIDDFPGKWVNVDPHTNNLTKVHIDMNGPMSVGVHAWGQCHPNDCDWGKVQGQFIPGGGGTVRATFDSGFSITLLELHNAPGQALTYDMHVKYTDHSGRMPADAHGVLARADGGGGMGGGGMGNAAMGPEDCMPEPWQQLQVAHTGGEWKIVRGSEWVLSFGANKAAADQSLSIIQHYRFDQMCSVQRPHPSMTYWKRGMDVPGGSTPGEDCIAFHPHQVAAAHVGGEWKVVDGSMWMLSYGNNEAAAEQAASVIKHYHLNRQCFVARPNPPMQYWLSE
jgi:hypothetical protein